MGRGGGGSGGSRSSGGGHSSRSFGGRSSSSSRGGGSSFSSSRGGSSYRSSYSSGPRVSHHYHHYGGGYGYGYSRPAGPMGTLITAAIVLFFIGILLFAITGGGSSVSKSTVEREKLKAYASFDKGAIDDDAEWIHDKKTLLRGMESFYKETGIQPAISIHEDIDGNKYVSDSVIEDFMEDTYNDLIGHERGVLLLFCEYEKSDWYAYYMVGEDAKTVMDSEACDILLDYVADLYTNSSYSDEEFFSAVFEKTGKRIMTVTPTVASKIPVMVMGVVIITLVIGAVAALKAKHKRDAEKAAETERILNTPIDRI